PIEHARQRRDEATGASLRLEAASLVPLERDGPTVRDHHEGRFDRWRQVRIRHGRQSIGVALRGFRPAAQTERAPTLRRMVERTMARTAERLRNLLADGPLPRRELVRLLGVEPGIWNGLGLWVDLVRVPPSGTWERRSADLYGLADAWIDMPQVSEAKGIELLIRRYLGGFGPSTTKEISGWSGVPRTNLEA